MEQIMGLIFLISGGGPINVLDIYLNDLVNKNIIRTDSSFPDDVLLPGLFTAIGSHVLANHQIGPVPASLQQENREERARTARRAPAG